MRGKKAAARRVLAPLLALLLPLAAAPSLALEVFAGRKEK